MQAMATAMCRGGTNGMKIAPLSRHEHSGSDGGASSHGGGERSYTRCQVVEVIGSACGAPLVHFQGGLKVRQNNQTFE